jgi:hypothetical protein
LSLWGRVEVQLVHPVVAFYLYPSPFVTKLKLTLFEVRSESVERCPAHRTHAGPAEEPATRAPLMKPVEIDRESFVNS